MFALTSTRGERPAILRASAVGRGPRIPPAFRNRCRKRVLRQDLWNSGCGSGQHAAEEQASGIPVVEESLGVPAFCFFDMQHECPTKPPEVRMWRRFPMYGL